MPLDPEVILSCVHLYSMIGDNVKSRYYDRLFVHQMKRSLAESLLDRHENLR
ncbi:MAG TPA: hypothetical protein VJ417_01685 [Candidatus Glassbacteria bacterium]|nr:hypothetical protein [Candidatus Glassbacteria bacterium]